MKTRPPITDAELLARDHAEPGRPGGCRIVNGQPEFYDLPTPRRYGWLKLALVAAVTVTLILCVARDARAGVAEVAAAEQAIEAAKAQRKEAMKGLTKLERAEINMLKAQRALEKARGSSEVDMPATTIKPSRKKVSV